MGAEPKPEPKPRPKPTPNTPSCSSCGEANLDPDPNPNPRYTYVAATRAPRAGWGFWADCERGIAIAADRELAAEVISP